MYHTNLAVIDIDGTIADGAHRVHLLSSGSQEGWDKFISGEEMAKDVIYPNALHRLLLLQKLQFRIVFLTGRNETLRSVTTKWLVDHLGPSFGCYIYGGGPDLSLHLRPILNYQLIMRPENNDEKPTIYKERELQQLFVENRPTTLLAFDDDPYMWPVYEKYGALVFKAPDCWSSLFPKASELAPEEVRRK